MRNTSDRLADKIKTSILCSIKLFFANIAVYETIWKNMVQPNRALMAIWRMRIARWILKVTNTVTHIYYISTPTIVAQTRLNVT